MFLGGSQKLHFKIILRAKRKGENKKSNQMWPLASTCGHVLALTFLSLCLETSNSVGQEQLTPVWVISYYKDDFCGFMCVLFFFFFFNKQKSRTKLFDKALKNTRCHILLLILIWRSTGRHSCVFFFVGFFWGWNRI